MLSVNSEYGALACITLDILSILWTNNSLVRKVTLDQYGNNNCRTEICYT